jgi:hypothetical protein
MKISTHASSVRNITPKGNHSSSVNSPTCGYFDDGSSATAAKRTKLNAFVLVDSALDVSLSSMSTKFNPALHLEFLFNKKNQSGNQKKAGISATT